MFPPGAPQETSLGAPVEGETVDDETAPTTSSSSSPVAAAAAAAASSAMLGAGAAKMDGLVKDAVGVKLWVRLAQAPSQQMSVLAAR